MVHSDFIFPSTCCFLILCSFFACPHGSNCCVLIFHLYLPTRKEVLYSDPLYLPICSSLPAHEDHTVVFWLGVHLYLPGRITLLYPDFVFQFIAHKDHTAVSWFCVYFYLPMRITLLGLFFCVYLYLSTRLCSDFVFTFNFPGRSHYCILCWPLPEL